jgi:signal transduction histidine kinase
MDVGSSQNESPDRLSVTAQRMLELQEVVFSEWENRVRATVDHAKDLPHPILINTFPAYYESLAQAISPDFPRRAATDTLAFEHGGERARLTDYTPQSVIAEYQLLRWTILDVLRMHDVHLNAEEFYTLSSFIDTSVRESATAYAMAQATLRERFLAALTHDLRNPLNNIVSAAELIMHLDDLNKVRDLAAKVIKNGRRIDQMTKDMLDCMQFQNGERLRLSLSQFNILEVAREICEQVTVNGDSRIQLVGKSASGWWDREALKRALENLVGNAIKYGSANTPILIDVNSAHERAIISVHNLGDPVDPGQMESIFQIFRRADAAKSGKRQGWGIGLPYVRSVAESHGGSVGVDSSAERGTTFVIDIPLDARPFQNKPTLGG